MDPLRRLYDEKLLEEATVFLQKSAPNPVCAVVFGSGMRIESPHVIEQIPYSSIPGMPTPTVAGHSGKLTIIGSSAKQALLWSGRFHLYEGYSIIDVLFPLAITASLNCKYVLLTNAAGGLNPILRAGDLFFLTDQLSFLPQFPLPFPLPPQSPYDPHFFSLLETIALTSKIPYQKGIYIGVSGPMYETPAEIRFYRRIGGDAIGMSTVLEASFAAATGMTVAGCSIITNTLSETSPKVVSHQEVLTATEKVQPKLKMLLNALFLRLELFS